MCISGHVSVLVQLKMPTLFPLYCTCIHVHLCDTDYVGYTTQHLHQHIGEHKHSAIERHLEDHGLSKSDLKDKQFSILRKCRTKFDCLIFEMLFIKELKPGLITQKDSVCAKLFT